MGVHYLLSWGKLLSAAHGGSPFLSFAISPTSPPSPDVWVWSFSVRVDLAEGGEILELPMSDGLPNEAPAVVLPGAWFR